MENIDTKALEVLFETELNEIQEQAVLYFQKFIKDRGLVLTNNLLEHFQKSTMVVASELYAEVNVTFNSYGRYLDMKAIGYKPGKPDPEGPLVEGMKEYIEKKGLAFFKGIPGYYGASRMPVTSIAINRLAYTLAYSRKNSLKIKRRGEGWYNKGRSLFVRDVRRKLQASIAELVLREVANGLEMTLEG
ncbi:hypothetical protein VB264_05150 [Arcicella aquatica]|uniref:Uncharacterized protein n=1 Tax=Arcicella aquatica TaxID=217141 RepID=A0ABU5QJF4_9BACT|nr:hypothetical protein [Arcicella aquatica]MEA5257163.1 hypothetical protein [Arcicella aquatica]